MEEREQILINTALGYIQPVLENAIVLGAKYCNATGRKVVTPLDIEYASKYCAMNSMDFTESVLDEEEEDSDEDDECPEGFVVNEEDLSFDDEFRKYEGDDELFNEINRAVENWNEWEPEFEYEIALKNAINRM
jgi:hypothetical protein